ncbi:MAG: hypothetical protein JXA54_10200 [Candidatus Heimdallarchaeota archaeon]|nr:hypothetical protein [Candidatus Heimdallarchaeota archaeon]
MSKKGNKKLTNGDIVYIILLLAFSITIIVMILAGVIPSFKNANYFAFAGWLVGSVGIFAILFYMLVRKIRSKGIISDILD